MVFPRTLVTVIYAHKTPSDSETLRVDYESANVVGQRRGLHGQGQS